MKDSMKLKTSSNIVESGVQKTAAEIQREEMLKTTREFLSRQNELSKQKTHKRRF
jgi:hypothetical protein